MEPGEIVGKYQLESLLARSGSAEAWLAQASYHGFTKKVFLKTLPHLTEELDLERFIEQVQLAAQLSHPNIVQIYDIGYAGGLAYVAMEFVAGLTVHDLAQAYARRNAVLPAWFVLRVLAKVCAGLQFAHDIVEAQHAPLSLFRRSLTPDDIMVSSLGDVKILELGIAGAASARPRQDAHRYLAPEQLRGAVADRRADVYALGICLYELCTGSPPFQGADEHELLANVFAGTWVPPRQRAPWLPVALERVIQRAMAPDPELRQGHAVELGVELLALLREAGDRHHSRELGKLVEQATNVTPAPAPVHGERIRVDSSETPTNVFDEATAVDDHPEGCDGVEAAAPAASASPRLDLRPRHAEVQTATASKKPTAETDVASAQTGVASAQTGLASAQTGLASAQTGLASAQTGLASAQTGLASAQTGVASAQTGVASAQTGVASAQTGVASAAPQGPAGKYEIVARIAKGHVAEIFLARARGAAGFQKKVVLKQVLPHLCSDETFIQLFLREAKLGAQLSHPNIVQIFDFGQLGDTYFIAREYVEGRGLDDVVLQVQRRAIDVPLALMVKIASFVADALHTAHVATDRQGKPRQLVHRGVSLSSILVSYDGAVKLTDFSMADAALSKAPAVSGSWGKYSYMSPQQALGQPIDHRADLFALGVVLYEATTLTRLFRRENDAQTIQALLEGPIPPPSRVVVDYPPALEKIVLQCLERNPERRYQDARTLHRDLERFLGHSRMGCSAADIAELMTELFPAEARPLELPPLEVRESHDPLFELSVSKVDPTLRKPSKVPRRPLQTRSIVLLLALMLVGSAALWAVILWSIGD